MSNSIKHLRQSHQPLVVTQHDQLMLPHRAFKVEELFPAPAVVENYDVGGGPTEPTAADTFSAILRLTEQQRQAYFQWCKERMTFQYDITTFRTYQRQVAAQLTDEQKQQVLLQDREIRLEELKVLRQELKAKDEAEQCLESLDRDDWPSDAEPTDEQIQEALAMGVEEDAEYPDNGVRIGSLLPYATYDEYIEACERANTCPLSEYNFREAKAGTVSTFVTYDDYITWATEYNSKCKCGECDRIRPISEDLFRESKELASELKDKDAFDETMMSIGITQGQNHAYMEWCKAKDVYQYDLENFQQWCESTEEPTNEQIQEARAIQQDEDDAEAFFPLLSR